MYLDLGNQERGMTSDKTFENSSPTNGQWETRTNRTHQNTFEQHSFLAPKHPSFSPQEARLTSFDRCRNIAVSKFLLSDAGFFYAGIGDCTRCFSCGIGIRDFSMFQSYSQVSGLFSKVYHGYDKSTH